MSDDLEVSPRVTIPAADLSWKAVRSAGPGGQNVNKVSSKIDLRFDVVGNTTLTHGQKTRLRAIPSVKLDAEGQLMLTCDETRDQRQNLQLVRQRLVALIRGILIPPKARRATRPTKGSVRRRLEGKKQNADKKDNRKKVSY